ncbi:L-rhamnono-gamma-lactonase [Colletotrichum orbiculare MAFF 240422]|uniref:L-rhamnono-gamma-lactonase n=1 Tax=Colletotrichum orbiculare (strain 104-T / ATCC 96160 / CBS 514.97 / LARS 414 / MAFF 240422) TaxID=1213857 RepID=N4VDM0_COLOR|nr:L-rhamnono-gamma-lactonase [Colletotrichum orbiculare MAFF 240422]
MADYPIVDSHIHLYPDSEVSTLAWATDPSNPIAKQHSVSDYLSATGQPANLKGFIFIETDRVNDLEGGARDASGWEFPLMEVAWLRRIAEGKPRDGEGHGPEHAALCLGIVPWAPLPSGPEALERYLARAEEVAGPDVWSKIRGFRYLLQDKPHGTGLTEEFIESLKLLGRRGFVFDMGVDQHRRGNKQLDEALEIISRAHESVPEDEKVTFVINHLCKPDLGIINTTDPSFVHWRTAIYALSKCSKTYMKLSGGFSEMPDSLKRQDPNAIFEAIFPWLGVVLATFGTSRTMFGSDWPVCTVGVPEAWRKWKLLVERTCYMATLEPEDQAALFGGTAIKAYGIEGV